MKFPQLVEHGKKLWDTWNIRAFIILSLSLQTILILVAPLRKRTSNKVIAFLIWSAYLLADWVAVFLVGHIASSEGESPLQGFWAPFLLLHLGGPDTITALNLEDNSLWIRHFLNFLLQVSITGYILIKTFPAGSKLRLPAILIFISGILKYFERIMALNRASIGKYRNSIFKDASKSMSGPHESDGFGKDDDLSDCEVAVKHAHNLYKMSRGVIVDLVLRIDELGKVREFFQNIGDPDDALKLLSIELNFFYDVLYTKAVVVHTKGGFVFRCLVYVIVTVALVLFVRLSKDMYREFDVKLTYALLLGAIVLDGIALLMILFSDWSVASIGTKFKNVFFLSRIFSCLTSKRSTQKWERKREYVPDELDFGQRYEMSSTSLLFRRWSGSISCYSLLFPAPPKYRPLCRRLLCICLPCIYLCIYVPQPVLMCLLIIYIVVSTIIELCFISPVVKLFNLVVDWLELKEEFDASKHVYPYCISRKLWKFIFMELKDKSTDLQKKAAAHVQETEAAREEAQKMIRSRGEWVLQTDNFEEDCKDILPYIKNHEYDQVLLIWNIATELCFYAEESHKGSTENEARYFSKTLSGYMLYLLIMQSSMMSDVAGEAPLRYRDIRLDTNKETTKMMDKKKKEYFEKFKRFWGDRGSSVVETNRPSRETTICRTILEDSHVGPGTSVLVGSKSVLSDACELARKLRSFNVERRWTIVSKVWVEMLSYAAIHCKGEDHARALSRGGELLTFVWLLMIHLGISQFGFEVSLATAQAK